jgi:hypothetical protein
VLSTEVASSWQALRAIHWNQAIMAGSRGVSAFKALQATKFVWQLVPGDLHYIWPCVALCIMDEYYGIHSCHEMRWPTDLSATDPFHSNSLHNC